MHGLIAHRARTPVRDDLFFLTGLAMVLIDGVRSQRDSIISSSIGIAACR
jgi:hypothetical protein